MTNILTSKVLCEAPDVYIPRQVCSSDTKSQMFVRPKKCKLSFEMMKRLNHFLFFFNLRQGAILIAVHQIALSSFILIILLVGISHVGEMLTMLHNDMEDDAERRGFYDIAHGNQLTFHEGNVISTNNQRRFAKAQYLASVTVFVLYTSTILTSIYLMCSIALLHGAVKYKKEYIFPWIIAATIDLLLLLTAIVTGDGYPCVVNLFNGHNMYHFTCALFVASFVYAICAVTSFSLEVTRWANSALTDERGERLLLLDHAAHSSLLSAAQLNKLSHGTRTQFV